LPSNVLDRFKNSLDQFTNCIVLDTLRLRGLRTPDERKGFDIVTVISEEGLLARGSIERNRVLS